MRAKKKNVGFAIIAKSKNKNKFTMDDLKEMEEMRALEISDPLIKTFQENLACKIQPVPVKVTLLCLVSHPKAATQFQDAASSKINQQALSIEAVRELILTRPRVKERCSKSWQIEKAQSFRPQRSEVLVQLTFQN